MKGLRIIFYKPVSLMTALCMTVMLLAGCGASSTENSNSNPAQTSAPTPAETSKAENQDSVEINIGNWAPATHHWKEYVFTPWKNMVEEKTDGRVKVNIFDGGVLGGSDTTLGDVAGGKYDLGMLVYAYFYDTPFFIGTIAMLPFAFNNVETAHKVAIKFVEKYGKDKFEQIHYGGAMGTDPYWMFSKKSIDSMEDLKGLNIRTPSKEWNPIIQAWGANPVSMPLNESYEALQRGTMDAILYSIVGGVGYKFHEVAPYVLKYDLYSNSSAIVLNKNTYNSIPEDIKPMFDNELLPQIPDLMLQDYKDRITESIAVLEKEATLIEPGEELKSAIKAAGKAAWDNWVKEANDRGYPGDEMMADFKQMIIDEGGTVPYE